MPITVYAYSIGDKPLKLDARRDAARQGGEGGFERVLAGQRTDDFSPAQLDKLVDIS